MTAANILVVEDNHALAENLAEFLEALGHQVSVAGSGAAALQLAQKGFDLAVLDVRLPDTDGTDLLPKLKGIAPDSEAIVMTGNADVSSAALAVAGGAFSYLIKPVGLDDLGLNVARALERVAFKRSARELQQALENSERRLRDIVDTVQAVIMVLDRHGCVVFTNQAAEQLSGWKQDALLGRDFFDVFAPPEQRAAGRRRALQPEASQAGEIEEMEFVCRDGSVRRVQMRWHRRAHGDTEQIYGMGLDVTRQRELERKARVSEKLALVGTMTAGLAHEIRNPLNAALLQLTVVDRMLAKQQSAANEPLALVRSELTRLETLLGDFLAFARPREFNALPVDLSSLAESVVHLHSELARSRGKTMTSEIEPGVAVMGDADALRGAAVNLAKNALEAARTSVVVRLVRDGKRARLTFEDDGPGIPADVAAHLFEPFFTTKDQGTGLGLAIVHQTITGHDGEVTLQSRLTGGTVATVTLPLR